MSHSEHLSRRRRRKKTKVLEEVSQTDKDTYGHIVCVIIIFSAKGSIFAKQKRNVVSRYKHKKEAITITLLFFHARGMENRLSRNRIFTHTSISMVVGPVISIHQYSTRAPCNFSPRRKKNSSLTLSLRNEMWPSDDGEMREILYFCYHPTAWVDGSTIAFLLLGQY